MLHNGIKYVAVLGSLVLFTAAACSDDDENTTSSTDNGTTTTTGATTTTGGMGGSGGGGEVTCADACGTLYDCGLEMSGADQLCPGFSGDAAEKDAFVDGCVTTCEGQPLLKNLVDGENCSGTITSVKGASTDFADVCDNGFGQGGGGA